MDLGIHCGSCAPAAANLPALATDCGGLNMSLVLVAAADAANAIGRAGGLPWHLPDDFKHFKAVTLGHPVLMGRRTFESIGKPLPGRENLVLTSDANWQHDGTTTVTSLDAAVALAGGKPLMVIGGGRVYAQTVDKADRIELTRVHTTIADADTWFPAFGKPDWRRIAAREQPADARHAHAMTFETWQRVA